MTNTQRATGAKATKAKRDKSKHPRSGRRSPRPLWDINESVGRGGQGGRPKRQTIRTAKFVPHSHDSNPNCTVGYGFACPHPGCDTLCRYDAKSCGGCKRGCAYTPGTGAVMIEDRPRNVRFSLKKQRRNAPNGSRESRSARPPAMVPAVAPDMAHIMALCAVAPVAAPGTAPATALAAVPAAASTTARDWAPNTAPPMTTAPIQQGIDMVALQLERDELVRELERVNAELTAERKTSEFQRTKILQLESFNDSLKEQHMLQLLSMSARLNGEGAPATRNERDGVRSRRRRLLNANATKSGVEYVPLCSKDPASTNDGTDDGGLASRAPKASAFAIQRELIPSNLVAHTALVQDADRTSTSDLIYFTLLQVQPYKTPGQRKAESDEDSRGMGFPGLLCRHCAGTPGGRRFLATSPDHLGDLLLTVADHSTVCERCPAAVKSQIAGYKSTHETQLRRLEEGEHDACMMRVWRQLIALNMAKGSMPATKAAPIQHNTVDPNMQLVTADEESLVTPFVYFAMQQVKGCNYNDSDNATRSGCGFDVGFPGLECKFCSGPHRKRFFYRSLKVLCDNYKQIPNHLMECSGCPPRVKKGLTDAKQAHLVLKKTLPKGSQKKFFNAAWERLHGYSAPSSMKSDASSASC